jgi:hypothetical protein
LNSPLRLFDGIDRKPLRGRKPADPPAPRPLSTVEKFRRAAMGRNWLAFVVGGVAGSFVPVASYHLARHEAGERPELWALIAAALLFSSLSVYALAVPIFDSRVKAAAFALLTEGVLILTSNPLLAWTALGLLVVANCTSAGVALALEDERYRSRGRRRA